MKTMIGGALVVAAVAAAWITSAVVGQVVTVALVALAATAVTWAAYLAVMNLERAKKRRGHLPLPAKLLGLPVVVVGVLLDALYNVVVGTAVFLELPREWLLTHRLERHLDDRPGWRHSIARWACVNLLDPFDPAGRHCD